MGPSNDVLIKNITNNILIVKLVSTRMNLNHFNLQQTSAKALLWGRSIRARTLALVGIQTQANGTWLTNMSSSPPAL